MSLARIVWRPQSVNTGGGLWWDCCLFVFCFTHTTEGQCECLCGRDWDVFLTLSSREKHQVPHLLFATQSSLYRVQEGLQLFPPLWALNTSTIQRLSGNFFNITLLNQHLLTRKLIQFLLTNGYIFSISRCVRDHLGTQ